MPAPPEEEAEHDLWAALVVVVGEAVHGLLGAPTPHWGLQLGQDTRQARDVSSVHAAKG